MNNLSSEIKIADFQKKYADDFRSLNLVWLDAHDLTEAPDLEMLNDPQGKIIDEGGFIFIALSGEKVIGTAALIKSKNNLMELAKMSIHKDYQGKGISKLLMDRCIDTARRQGTSGLYLYSSTKLKAALSLYEKYGFKHVPLTNSKYLTADVYMQLSLEERI
jgi:GNAT superfamily N-acetyltransferase